MLDHLSKEFKAFFFLVFTRELINNSGGDLVRLKKILNQKKPEDELAQKVREKLYGKLKESDFSKEESFKRLNDPIIFSRRSMPIVRRQPAKAVLRIPATRLPPQFQYLKQPAMNVKINLGKLNSLLQDPDVKIVECNGKNENVFVKGAMGMKKTAVVLSEEEINQIIEKFAETAKIPVNEGVFNVVVGDLELSAVISKALGSRFVIKKIVSQIMPRG